MWQNTTIKLFLLKGEKVAYNIDQWIDIMVMEDHAFVSKSYPITHSKFVTKHFICLLMIFPLSIKLHHKGINQQIVKKDGGVCAICQMPHPSNIGILLS